MCQGKLTDPVTCSHFLGVLKYMKSTSSFGVFFLILSLCHHPPPTTPPADWSSMGVVFHGGGLDWTRPFRFTSTEARWLIRDGDKGGRRRKSEGSTVSTTRKRPERPWTATRTIEVLRQRPLAIAQWLMRYAVAVSTAMLGQSHKDNIHCIAVEQQPEAKEVQLSQPSSTSLLMISSGLTWRSSSTSLL